MNEPFSLRGLSERFRSALLPLLDAGHHHGRDSRRNFHPHGGGRRGLFVCFPSRVFRFSKPSKYGLIFRSFFINTVVTTAMVFLIFCMGQVLVALLTINQVPQKITELMLSVSSNPLFLSPPGQYPASCRRVLYRIRGRHYRPGSHSRPGCREIGHRSLAFRHGRGGKSLPGASYPSHGRGLFVVCGIAKISLEEITRAVWPFMVAILIVLFLITYIPWLTLAIPRYFGF